MIVRKLDDFMVKRGGSIDPSKFKNETFELLSIPAFDQGFPEILAGDKIGSSKKMVKPGDVLLSKIVPHIRRCWIVPERSSIRQIASGEWIQFRSDELFPGYLRLFLVSNGFHSQFMKTVKGVGGSLLRASPAQVAEIEIPVPHINDQIRIAYLLGKVEDLIVQRKQHLQQLDALLKSVFMRMFGDPVQNDKKWEIGSLRTYGSFKNGLNFGKGERGSIVRYIGVGDFKSKSKLDDIDKLGYVELNDLPSVESFLQDGDILFVRSNGNRELVGRCMVIYPGSEKITYSGFCIRYRTSDSALQPTYIAHLFRSTTFRRTIFQGGQGANIQNISQQALSDLLIPLPPEDLQKQFATTVKTVEVLKSGYQDSLNDLEALYGVLSQLAFQGELDLSRVSLPIEHALSQNDNHPIQAEQSAIPGLAITPVELVNNLMQATSPGAEERSAFLARWLESYLINVSPDTRQDSSKFLESAWQTIQNTQFKSDGESPALMLADYDMLRDLIFEKLQTGELMQTFDAVDKRVVLQKRCANGRG